MSLEIIIVGLGEALWDVLPGGKVLGGAPLNVACHVHALLQGSAGASPSHGAFVAVRPSSPVVWGQTRWATKWCANWCAGA